jgi:hypothetical protein
MKHLHTMTAVIEAGAGLALLVVPAIVVRLLLGAEISGAGILLGRVAGAALFALGVACWFARGDAQSPAARGLVATMTFYNFAAVAVFLSAGLESKPAGIALWPAVILHAAMGVWCVTSLRRNADGNGF